MDTNPALFQVQAAGAFFSFFAPLAERGYAWRADACPLQNKKRTHHDIRPAANIVVRPSDRSIAATTEPFGNAPSECAFDGSLDYFTWLKK